jgi:hypothetical protein
MWGLSKVPCAYIIDTDSISIKSTGPGQFRDMSYSNIILPSLRKRIYWILTCGGLAGANIICFDYLKSNISRYFLEVNYIFVPIRYPWGWSLTPTTLSPKRCFYLGQWPNFWDYANQRIVYAHHLWTYKFAPMGNAPIMYNYDSLMSSFEAREKLGIEGTPIEEFIPEAYKNDRETMEFFHGKYSTDQYFAQAEVLANRQKRFNECISRNYPKSTKTPQTKVQTPKGEAEFPGVPIHNLTLPPPTSSPFPHPGPGRSLVRLTLSMGIESGVPYNAMDLTLTLQELTLI